ncbi:hypothetical protein [Listeria costaricensis]|uniref:hypothetical protein n=1 Tax=Listeria costaricensis TaxID=2026604 RepID=UPI0013C422B1|nr:hypothetical protein [Listeria costaricensis]
MERREEKEIISMEFNNEQFSCTIKINHAMVNKPAIKSAEETNPEDSQSMDAAINWLM